MDRTISIVGRKLSELRRSKNMKRESLASAIDMSVSGVYKIEKSPIAKIFLETASKLAAALKMSDDEFAAAVGRASRGGVPAFDLVSGSPILGEVTAGGLVESLVYEADEQPERIPINGGPDSYALRVRGDSMEPEYHDGDFILCQVISLELAEAGDDVVVQCGLELDGASTLKRLISQKNGKLHLQPLNKAKHKAIECPVESVVRISRVMGTWKPRNPVKKSRR